MTQHLVSQHTLYKTGETSAEFFRRVARDKPKLPGMIYKGCAYCNQDHRGPEEYWPDSELASCKASREGVAS